MNELDEETAKKVENEWLDFQENTRELKTSIDKKRIEMHSEMTAKEPDAQKLKNYNKELSELLLKLDDAYTDHIIAMKKIVPNFGNGFMGGGCGLVLPPPALKPPGNLRSAGVGMRPPPPPPPPERSSGSSRRCSFCSKTATMIFGLFR